MTIQAVQDTAESVTPENTAPEANEAAENVDVNQTPEAGQEGAEAPEQPQEGDKEESGEFPKKAVNALNRRNKTISKLRAQLRELEEKLAAQETQPKERTQVSPDDYETYGEYLKAEMKAEMEDQLRRQSTEQQKQHLSAQKEQLAQQRDMEIAQQAQELAAKIPDLKQTMQPHIQTLDALPQQIADIFYSLDNAPIAAYVLAKEGKLESLSHVNQAVAAYEIINAHNKGLAMIAKQSATPPIVSQAPQPMKAAKGTGTFKKQLTPQDDVLKSLGLKK